MKFYIIFYVKFKLIMLIMLVLTSFVNKNFIRDK